VRAEEVTPFHEWARGRQPSLRRTAYLLCGDWDHAQDLVQETLTRVYRHWSRLSARGRPDAYARQVLVNAYTDERRRRSSGERPVAELPEMADSGDSDSRALLRVTLMAALARMPRSQRAVLVLRYWEDLSQAQTAALLGCSEGNVKSQAARGLVALREELARLGVDLSTTVEGDGGDGGATDDAVDLDAGPDLPQPRSRRTRMALPRVVLGFAHPGLAMARR